MVLLVSPLLANSQTFTDYVLLGGASNCTGCGVFFGSSSVVSGGKVGSYSLIQSSGATTINGEVNTGSSYLMSGKMSQEP
jgi:hypothetical protein